MKKVFAFIGNFFSSILAIAFVATMIVAVYAISTDRRLSDADTYKNILERRQVYDRLPRVLAEQMVYSMNTDACAENPLLCRGETDQSRKCYEDALGTERYNILLEGMDRFSPDDLKKVEPCLKEQYGNFPPQVINALNTTSVIADANPEIQGCITGTLGDGSANEISSHKRLASIQEADAIIACFNKSGRDPYQDSRPVAFIRNLRVQDWEIILRAIVPPDDMKLYAENTIDQTSAFIGGQQRVVSLDLRNLKQRIGGQSGRDAMFALINNQAACTDDTFKLMSESLSSPNANFVLCKPDEKGMGDILPRINSHLERAASLLPDDIVLAEPITADTQIEGNPAILLSGLSEGIHVLRLTVFVPLILMFLITLFSINTLKSWLRWWGLPLLISGLSTIALRIVLSLTAEQHYLNSLLPQSTVMVSGMVDLINEIFNALMNSVNLTATMIAIVITVVGAAMFFGSYFVKPEVEEEITIVPTDAGTQG